MKRIREMEFKRNSKLGKKFSCGPFSRCINETSQPHGIIIGNNVEILGKLHTQGSGRILIGDNTTIRFSSKIRASKSVSIGNDVIISNNVLIADNNSHPVSPSLRKKMTSAGFYGDLWQWKWADAKCIVLEDNVWIGERSMILKGVTIGEGAVVGAMSLVTKDVGRFTVVAGNPAKFVKKIR